MADLARRRYGTQVQAEKQRQSPSHAYGLRTVTGDTVMDRPRLHIQDERQKPKDAEEASLMKAEARGTWYSVIPRPRLAHSFLVVET